MSLFKVKKFPHFKQANEMDCGATCLRIICKYFGMVVSATKLRDLCFTTNRGVNMLGIAEAAEELGLAPEAIQLPVDELDQVRLPAILHWKQNHFVVLYKIQNEKYYISDPANKLIKYSREDFENNWYPSPEIGKGVLISLSSPKRLNHNFGMSDSENRWKNILRYFSGYTNLFIQLFIGLILSGIFDLSIPFLTQNAVDLGINQKNIDFLYFVLFSQLLFFVGQISISVFRSWTLLHISTRVNIEILTDFLIRLMKLPFSFFDKRTSGDILQRMEDQQRIEEFITKSFLDAIYSIIHVMIFGSILYFYSTRIFIVFFVCTIVYIIWILIFMRSRKEIDIRQFDLSSLNSTYTVEMIQSIRDIKLNNAEQQIRWIWEDIQARIFKLKEKSLFVFQAQSIGSTAINSIRTILITFLSARAVIDGDMTIGAMMAVQYITGSIDTPIKNVLALVQSYQDASLSVERLNEIYETEEERVSVDNYTEVIPSNAFIRFENVTFKYFGSGNKPIFTNLNMHFPEGKTTAIVGESGSGKTTILKLILRFYDLQAGIIKVGNYNLESIDFKIWRDACGCVLQDNIIFSNTIEENISIGGNDQIDYERLNEAIKIACLEDFINEQPFGLKTKIGNAGKGISQGQKQRILIARAIYKQPKFIFLDEATNALDAKNEKNIINNLSSFFKNRTVIVVAHRLSTVKNADNIIVMEKGAIVEQGNHSQLVAKRATYFHLIKNQLELSE
ncbi:peptidase domain-containing ABC transporter [Sphingobacterium sp. DR205]|nr:peptidase domain-containing ABC transporter [Sphingobacterium sp. DR205]